MAGKGKSERPRPGDVATNRQARHSYEFVETFEAGSSCRGPR